MPPVTLTKPQFLSRKPKGNYATYLKFIKNRRAGRTTTPTVASGNGGVPSSFGDLLKSLGPVETPAQMEARANRMAQTQMNYQRKLMDEEYAAGRKDLLSQRALEREDAMRQMRAFQEAGRAAAAMNAELMGRVGGAYRSGAGEISGLAGALGAAAAGATAADVAAANQGLGAAGMGALPTGGPVGLPGIAGANQAAVEIYRGGTLPANELGAASVAGELGIGGLIGAQNLRATQEAQAGYIETTRELERAFSQESKNAQTAKARALRELAAGRPGVAMQFLEQLQTSRNNQIALSQSLIGARNAARLQAQEASMAKEKFKIDKSQVDPAKSQATGYVTYVDGTQPRDENNKKIPVNRLLTPEQRLALQSQRLKNRLAVQAAKIEWSQVDVARSISGDWLVDRRGKFILSPDGKKIPSTILTASELGIGKGGGKTGGVTPNKMAEIMENAQSQVESFFYGYVKDDKGKRIPATQSGDFDPNDPSTWGTGGLDYPTALRRLTRLGVPASVGREMLAEYYSRGQDGMPIFTQPEIKMIRKRFGQAALTNALAQIKMALKHGNGAAADRIIEDMLTGRGIGF